MIVRVELASWAPICELTFPGPRRHHGFFRSQIAPLNRLDALVTGGSCVSIRGTACRTDHFLSYFTYLPALSAVPC